jgi:hypothetical protein
VTVDRRQILAGLIADGLSFGECVEAFATDDPLIEKARDEYVHEGEVEIDDATVVSRGDDSGAYVLAWVWVDDPEPAEAGVPS